MNADDIKIELEPIKFEIAKLELQPGDILVVRLESAPSQLVMDMVNRALRSLLGGANRHLFIGKDVELSILTKAEIEARAEGGDVAAPTG